MGSGDPGKRLGFIGIVLDRKEGSAASVNEVISRNSDLILARTGVPRAGGGEGVITLIVEATTDDVGRLTGQLGMISGVTVKSALTKEAGKK